MLISLEDNKRTVKILSDFVFLKAYIELKKIEISRLQNDKSKCNLESGTYQSIEDSIQNLKGDINKSQRIVDKVYICLEPLTCKERRIIELKYFNGMSNEVVARELDYCKKQIERINKKIITKLSIMLWGHIIHE